MRKSSEKFDVHQEITNRIVDALETAGEFQLPWIRNKGGSFARPVNIASKNPYNGVNIVSLWVSAQASWVLSIKRKSMMDGLEGSQAKDFKGD